MKWIGRSLVCLLVLSVTPTWADEIPTAWTHMEQPANLEGNSACSAQSPFYGPGELTLSVKTETSDQVMLEINAYIWRTSTPQTVTLAATFSDGVSLRMPAQWLGQFVEVTWDAATFRPWIHELTAADWAELSLVGLNLPKWRLPLRGASAAVDAVQRCVLTAGMRGVPPPFRSAPGGPLKAAGPCSRYGAPVSLSGRIIGVQANDPETGQFRFAELVLKAPICTTPVDDGLDDVAENGVVRLQLVASETVPPGKIGSLIGYEVHASGTLSHSFNAHHFTRVLLTLQSVVGAE